MWGFPDGSTTIITYDGCGPIKQEAGSVCLSTGSQNIYGITWGVTSQREITRSSDCKVQYPDVYHIALPGEQRKPYADTVTKLFDHAGAIDWPTHTFKSDKLSVVQQIYAQHGNGLNEAQLAALATQN